MNRCGAPSWEPHGGTYGLRTARTCKNVRVPTLEPSVALSTCETALRELMTYAYEKCHGSEWLEQVSKPEQREQWAERATVEAATRGPRGVAQIPNVGLAYANFYDLVGIIKKDKNWEPLAGALVKKSEVISLLEQFEKRRNCIAHSRPLLTFEKEMLSGIAGMIRNQVTIHMSAKDHAGDIYPRIESITDSLGRVIEPYGVDGELAGCGDTPAITVHPGETVRFTCVGIDPQERQLKWDLSYPDFTLRDSKVSESGVPVDLEWVVGDDDVNLTAHVNLQMSAHEAKYRRYRSFDHRAYFEFSVQPPA